MRFKKVNSNNHNKKLYKKEGNLCTKLITDQLTQHCAAPETKNKMAPIPFVFSPKPETMETNGGQIFH